MYVQRSLGTRWMWAMLPSLNVWRILLMLCDCSVSAHDATLAETSGTTFHICDTVWDQEANNYCTHVWWPFMLEWSSGSCMLIVYILEQRKRCTHKLLHEIWFLTCQTNPKKPIFLISCMEQNSNLPLVWYTTTIYQLLIAYFQALYCNSFFKKI